MRNIFGKYRKFTTFAIPEFYWDAKNGIVAERLG